MWRIKNGQGLAHQCWDHECALYNDLSGATHLVERAMVDLLARLAAQPMSPEALAGEGFGEAAELDLVLGELQRLHLIEAVPCSP